MTPAKPYFCDHCGRSYDVRLCPRLHPNPRSAELCARCGSPDLSTPQPRGPWWVPVVQFLCSLIPGAFLSVGSLVILIAFSIAILEHPEALLSLLFLGIAYGILWQMWSEIPAWIRTHIYRLLKRRREGDWRDGE
jgi:hypothetical protein